jgi:competence ComEA-like helix-hairpin-helix protein
MKTQTSGWKALLADYFTFSKWQRKIVITLFVICLICVFAPLIFLRFYKSKLRAASPSVVQLENGLKVKSQSSAENAENTDYALLQQSTNPQSAVSLFYFDPNTASGAEWQKLGVREKTVHTIQNYLAKGGRFRKPDDLKKIYGLKPADADRLVPYVRIASDQKPEERSYAHNADKSARKEGYKPAQDFNRIIEINAADTTAFIMLPGIGSKLAARIVNYRDKLHGFYSVDQLGETYGLPDSTFQKIKPRLSVNPALIRKIPLNTATADELKTPLIKYNVANAIIQHRQKNGPFKSVEDLKNIPLIDDYLYQRIVFYLGVD